MRAPDGLKFPLSNLVSGAVYLPEAVTLRSPRSSDWRAAPACIGESAQKL